MRTAILQNIDSAHKNRYKFRLIALKNGSKTMQLYKSIYFPKKWYLNAGGIWQILEKNYLVPN
jgi:hypothetical protein